MGRKRNLYNLQETQAWMARLLDEALANARMEADQRKLGTKSSGNSVDDKPAGIDGVAVSWLFTTLAADLEYRLLGPKLSSQPHMYPLLVDREFVLKPAARETGTPCIW